MTTDISLPRMSHLSQFSGTIGVEGLYFEQEIVVRIPLSQERASDEYYRLVNME